MEVDATQFQLARCQATVWTPPQHFSVLRVVRTLPEIVCRHFPRDPEVLPHVEGIPPDVPRLVSTSDDRQWRLEFAPARVNLYWTMPDDYATDFTIRKFADLAIPMILGCVESSGGVVQRAATVAVRYSKHDQPGRFLAQHFCKPDLLSKPFNRPESFELHAHKTYHVIPNRPTNSWVRCKSAMLTARQEAFPVVVVEQDINTAAESTEPLSRPETQAFFEAATVALDAILNLYFPAAERSDA